MQKKKKKKKKKKKITSVYVSIVQNMKFKISKYFKINGREGVICDVCFIE